MATPTPSPPTPGALFAPTMNGDSPHVMCVGCTPCALTAHLSCMVTWRGIHAHAPRVRPSPLSYHIRPQQPAPALPASPNDVLCDVLRTSRQVRDASVPQCHLQLPRDHHGSAEGTTTAGRVRLQGTTCSHNLHSTKGHNLRQPLRSAPSRHNGWQGPGEEACPRHQACPQFTRSAGREALSTRVPPQPLWDSLCCMRAVCGRHATSSGRLPPPVRALGCPRGQSDHATRQRPPGPYSNVPKTLPLTATLPTTAHHYPPTAAPPFPPLPATARHSCAADGHNPSW